MSVKTTILDDGKRLVINHNGWEAHRQNLDQQLAMVLTRLHSKYLHQHNTVIGDAIAIDEPDFIASGFRAETKAELAAKNAEIDHAYNETVLLVVAAYHQAQIAGMLNFLQLLPPLPFLGHANMSTLPT